MIMILQIVLFGVALIIAPNSTPGAELLDIMSTYALLLGDFEQQTYFGSGLLTFLFLVYTLVMTIVMLNIAISIISDTYDRVQTYKDILILQIRAELLQTYQRTDGDLLRPKSEELRRLYYPHWLHVIKRKDGGTVGDDQEWLGRVVAVNKKIEKMEARSTDFQARTQDSLDEIKKEMTKMQSSMRSTLDGMRDDRKELRDELAAQQKVEADELKKEMTALKEQITALAHGGGVGGGGGDAALQKKTEEAILRKIDEVVRNAAAAPVAAAPKAASRYRSPPKLSTVFSGGKQEGLFERAPAAAPAPAAPLPAPAAAAAPTVTPLAARGSIAIGEVRQGFLWKQRRGREIFRRRYFTLAGGELAWFDDEGLAAAGRRRSDAVLNVSDLVIEPLDPSTSANGRYPFRITPPSGRSRADSAASRGFSIRDSAAALMGGGGRDSAVLEAETEEDAQAWVDAISSWQSAGLLSALL